MFGLSAAEIMILLIVGIVVVGPQKLPPMLRTAGKWVAKLRRMSTDLRAQSGIDRIIREEGLEKEIRELRALRESLSKSSVINQLMEVGNATNAALRPPPPRPAVTSGSTAAALSGASTPSATSALPAPTAGASSAPASASSSSVPQASSPPSPLIRPAANTVAHTPKGPVNGAPYRSVRTREYPTMGCDGYDVLPDDLDEAEAEEEAEMAAQAAALEPPPAPPEDKPAVPATDAASEAKPAEPEVAARPVRAPEPPTEETQPGVETTSPTTSPSAPTTTPGAQS